MKRATTLGILFAVPALAATLAILQPTSPPVDSIGAGMRVYQSEGCLHCHSQFVRPGTLDVSFYGAPDAPPEHDGKPVLIGNRRQGPDLSHLGARRSREWNRLHLIDPQAVSPGSRMPGYAHLFAPDDRRGETLLDYLQSLGTNASHSPSKPPFSLNPTIVGDSQRGASAFAQLCASCHGPQADGRGSLAAKLQVPPANLRDGPYRFVPLSLDPATRAAPLGRIIKYGIAGTSMPGHEYLSDSTVADLVAFLLERSASPS